MEIADALVPISICVICPVTIVWLALRAKMYKDNQKKEILLAAMSKNSEVDIEDLLRKLNGPQKMLKEKLLEKLHRGTTCTILGVGVAILDLLMWINGQNQDEAILVGVVAFALLAVGVAFLLSYRVGKQMLEQEMQAETAALENQA
ncbi:MAG: hypothetical protein KBT15_06835 [Bacteroidales bacterium]|nr:hypothetical protein [Candidatus Minthousia equi]